MKKFRNISVVVASSLLIGNVAYAKFGDAVVGGIVGGAVGSVITNEIYNSKKQSAQPQQGNTNTKTVYQTSAPKLTDEKKIQTALSSLGFYKGRIDGEVNSYETRAAIKEMNQAYEISQNASLNPEAKDTLIFLGTLFEFDRYLIATGTDTRTKSKRIQTALKLHGYYSGTIDGVIGSGTRSSIAQYKADNGMSSGSALDFEEEYKLSSSAKEKNDQNIEESIAALKALGKQPAEENKVIHIQQNAQ